MLIPRLMAAADWADLALGGLVLFVATLAARAIAVFGLVPLLGRTPGHAGEQPIQDGHAVGRPARRGIAGAGAGRHRAARRLPHRRAPVRRRGHPASLLTLFINGITLRPLIRMLRLNELSRHEAHPARPGAGRGAGATCRKKTDEVARDRATSARKCASASVPCSTATPGHVARCGGSAI